MRRASPCSCSSSAGSAATLTRACPLTAVSRHLDTSAGGSDLALFKRRWDQVLIDYDIPPGASRTVALALAQPSVAQAGR